MGTWPWRAGTTNTAAADPGSGGYGPSLTRRQLLARCGVVGAGLAVEIGRAHV